MESGTYASLVIMPVYLSGKRPGKWEVQVKEFVRRRYGHLITSNGFPPGGTERSLKDGYPKKKLDKLPKDVTDLYCGCGFPFQSVDFSDIQTVVDLGCGVGLDSMFLSDFLKNKGKVISLDFAFPMIRKLKDSMKKYSKNNVFPVLGDIEEIPLRDEFADLLFANASFNLTVRKENAFNEAYRILRPGGKLIIRELALENSLPKEIEQDPSAWNASLGGVVSEVDWFDILSSAGFVDIEISNQRHFYPVISLKIEACKKKYFPKL